MPRPNYLECVKNRINTFETGTVFTATDFADIADAKTVHMSLTRLTDENTIRKVTRGIYLKPKFSTLLNEELHARPDDVAHSIARNYGWTIIPSDAAALNVLGLSTQVPAKWQYISNGPYKEYNINGTQISFKHTNKNTELTQVSYKTALVIRALKALGKNNVSESEIRSISEKLSESEINTLVCEAKYSTSWIYEIIKTIGREVCNAQNSEN